MWIRINDIIVSTSTIESISSAPESNGSIIIITTIGDRIIRGRKIRYQDIEKSIEDLLCLINRLEKTTTGEEKTLYNISI